MKIHLQENILDQDGKIDQTKLDLIARLGNNWYSRVNLGLFEVEKPITTLGIGVDKIPEFVKQSLVFDGNDLGKLANVESLPTSEEINIFVSDNFAVKAVLSSDDLTKIHNKAKEFLNNNDAQSAWKVLLANK